MEGLGLLFGGVLTIGIVVFLIACPVIVPWLLGLGVIGFAALFVRRRLPQERAQWFNTALIMLGALSGSAFHATLIYLYSGEVALYILAQGLIVGAVLSLASWRFDWPNLDGGVVILLFFLALAGITMLLTNIALVEFGVERPPGAQLNVEHLVMLSFIFGSIPGFGSCFLQRLFGVNPKKDLI